MKIHLKNYPCNNGLSPKGEPYTVHVVDVTCKACLNPPKAKVEPKKVKTVKAKAND